jgi:non-ribosomal peptide synthetase component F/glycosyltransferase involved in cell wall biosynthesis/acyl carrier protein
VATALGTLLNGATLCPRDLAVEGVATLAGWLVRERITVYVSAGTVFRHFARALSGRERFPDMRLVRLASEPAYRSDLDLLQARFPADCVFANTYSCTEAGNICRFFADGRSRLPGDAMPIGLAAEDLRVTLQDESGRVVNEGEVGEIVVRSRYLSPGYWNDPEQTRAAFREVPGSDERIYRTRDLGRMLPDGSLEHRGRKDGQLKIRGFRVCPEEIQDRLCRHPAVADAVADARTDAAGNARLVAYFVPCPGTAPAPGELRRHLRQSLPDFMVPAVLVPLETLPRTPNGKVDRDALRSLALPEPAAAEPGARPRTTTEEQIADVWAEVLELDAIGPADSFFDLGGDSLSVTQALARIEELLHVDLSVADLFEHPTLEGLAALAQSRGEQGRASPFPPIVAVPRELPLPLSFSQERSWRFSQTTAGSLDYVVASGYALEGLLDRDALRRSLDEVVRRHETLRTTYASADGRQVQIVHPAAPLELRTVDLTGSRDAAAALDRLRREEARTPIDLACGPLLRATLVRFGETYHQLLFATHHILWDGWTRQNFRRELGLLYVAFAGGRPSPLPEPALHYADFADWQRRLLHRDAPLRRAQLAYWRGRLSGAPAGLELPLGWSRAAGAPAVSDCHRRWGIPAETAQRLREVGRRAGATMFMTRLAVFAAALQRLTGVEDLVIGTYLTNRSRPETLGMIGFFSNLVMLRIDLSGDPTFGELLSRVRETTLGAAAHGDLPFEELCAALRDERRSPPEVGVIFQLSTGEVEARFGGLKVRRLEKRFETMPWGLQVSVENWGDQQAGRYVFDGRLYDPAKVAALLSDFERLQGQAADAPERRLSEFRVAAPDGTARSVGRPARHETGCGGRPSADDPADGIVRESLRLARRLLGHCRHRLFETFSWKPRLGVLVQHAARPVRLPRRYHKLPALPRHPTISIVTPSLNQGGFIERTIRSVLDQGYPQLEYVVQDAASTDDTPAVLARHAAALTFWESAADDGQSHALNRGYSRTSGEIMAYLNADDVLLPGALHAVAEFFLQHPEVDVLYGNRLLIDGHDLQIGRWVLPPHDDQVLLWADFVPQETLFWRRRLWDRVGARIDESYDFAMDWELLLRFREAGARFARLPRFLGGFRVHPAQKSSARINDLGITEMRRLRERSHGRAVSPEEIGRNIAWYLWKHRLWDAFEAARLALFRAERSPAIRRPVKRR